MPEMRVMGRSGDKRSMWSADNPDEVASARREFDELRKRGYVAYRVTGRRGDRGEIMREFDPEAEAMILVPPMAGG